jgi:hypothetical protein
LASLLQIFANEEMATLDNTILLKNSRIIFESARVDATGGSACSGSDDKS